MPVERFKLFQQMHGGGQPQRIELDQSVDFTTPGIERFKTLPVDSTDGLAKPRRDFRLPESDEAFLDSLGLRWEAVIDQGVNMASFCPALARADGKGINGLSGHVLDVRNFQQWSRHRTAQNPWRPGEDDLQSHVLLVEHWLCHELTR